MMFALSRHLEHGERVKIIVGRTVLILVAILIIASVLIIGGRRYNEVQSSCGTGAPSPEAATEDLMMAVSKSDWATACKYTTSDQNTVRKIFNGVTKTENHKAKKVGSKNGRIQVSMTGSTGGNGDEDVSWSFWTTKMADGGGWLVIIDPS